VCGSYMLDWLAKSFWGKEKKWSELGLFMKIFTIFITFDILVIFPLTVLTVLL